MFNECLIHLCDCTWLNVLHLLNHMLIKHKKIFEYFNCFWKVFLFWKISKISKTVQLCFSDSLSRVKPITSLLKSSRNSLASQAPNREKDLEKFQFSRFLSFSRLTLATGSRVEAPVASLLRMLRNSLHDLLASRPSNRKKHLVKFFKIYHTGFWWLDLATCSRLILVTKNTCFAQIGLNSRQFSKTFQFSLASCVVSLSCPPLPLPKPASSLTKPPFSSSILPQSSRKGMGFLLFSKYSCF